MAVYFRKFADSLGDGGGGNLEKGEYSAANSREGNLIKGGLSAGSSREGNLIKGGLSAANSREEETGKTEKTEKRIQGSEKHKREHRAGLELLKESLFREFSGEFSCTEEEFCLENELEKEELGKPFLKNYPQVHFNISHGKDMVVCGVGTSPLGVDVEAIRPVKRSMSRRVLTPGEQIFLEESEKNGGENGWYRDFFRLWTLKESYVKAVGKGLSIDFTTLEFILTEGKKKSENPDIRRLFPGKKEKQKQEYFLMEEVICYRLGEEKINLSWRFFQTILDGEYVVSCCLLR